MMKDHIDPNGSSNNAGICQTTSPNQHAQPHAFTGDEGETKESKKSRLSGAEHAFSPNAFPCADHAAHQHVHAKAPSCEPDTHEERHWKLRTPGQQDHGHNRKQ